MALQVRNAGTGARAKGLALRDLERLRLFLLGLLIVSGIGSSLLAILPLGQGWGAASLNLGTELLGAVVTYFVFELIIGRRERMKARERQLAAEKRDLIIRLGSRVNERAIAAIEELWEREWLPDQLPTGIKLTRADLRDAPLGGASLPDADLCWANLSGANLSDADLTGANLFRADLTDANLSAANLNSAYLTYAEVSKEQLMQARTLEGATLPDQTRLRTKDWKAEFEEWREK